MTISFQLKSKESDEIEYSTQGATYEQALRRMQYLLADELDNPKLARISLANAEAYIESLGYKVTVE